MNELLGERLAVRRAGSEPEPVQGKHAYSHVNSLSSAFQAYLATGERRYLDAARNGFAFIEAQTYATGGWGPNEELLAADDDETLLTMLVSTERSFETPCGAYAHCAYAHFKIARSSPGSHRAVDAISRVERQQLRHRAVDRDNMP